MHGPKSWFPVGKQEVGSGEPGHAEPSPNRSAQHGRYSKFGKAPTIRYPELHREGQASQLGSYQAPATQALEDSVASLRTEQARDKRREIGDSDGNYSPESELIDDTTPESPSGTPREVNGQDRKRKHFERGDDVEDLDQDLDMGMEDEGGEGYEDEEMLIEEEEMEQRASIMNFELRDIPETSALVLSSLQHIMALIGNFIVIPMILVPKMGGTHVDTALVINAVLMVSGLSTLLHILFGTRLPLMQGSSFVYLAPAVAIATASPDVLAIADPDQRFSQAMREVTGSVICASLAQLVLGYSGFMGLLIELINPVVVAPTMAAVGFSLFAYGFPKMGSCFEIGIPQIILATIFALYLRRVSVLGCRLFQIQMVSISTVVIWIYAAILTAAGVYNFSSCNTSNLLVARSPQCSLSELTMDACRTDASDSLAQTPWFPPPYPFRFGMPVFRWSSVCVMVAAALVSTVDSVGNYHASSLLVAVRPPTGGVVSRGIGMEGVTSLIAGVFGTGTGATTLSENVHVIAVTRMGSRVAVALAAGVITLLSLFGKVGALLAMLPPVMIGALVCVMAPMVCALGLSSLRYAEMGSSRNLLITGMALFLSISVPEYFRGFTLTNGHGPVNTSNAEVNFFLNTLFSLHMVIAFLVSFVLDNTVPGSPMERGLFVWSSAEVASMDEGVREDYSLPWGVGRFFRWAWWLGLREYNA